MHKLGLLVRVAPHHIATPFDQRKIGAQKRPPDILREGEIFFPIAGIAIVIKYPADAPCTSAMWDKEILIRPFF